MTTMTWLNDYQKQAEATAIYPPHLALHYLVPSLIVELDELRRALLHNDDPLGEIGDCLWMVAMLARTIDTPLQTVYGMIDLHATLDEAQTMAMSLLNVWTKAVRDHAGDLHAYWHSKKHILDKHAWMASLSIILHALEGIATQNNTSLPDVAQHNIDKLASRKDRGQLTGSGDHR